MRNLKYIVLFTFFSQLLTVNTFAQTTYTLQQCINFALKNHRSLKVADNDVKVAYARKKEGQSAYFPQINGLVKWDYNMQLQKSLLPDELTIPGTTNKEVAFGNKFNTLLGVQLDQFLYNKSYIDGINAIKPSYELSELKKVKTEEEVIYNTVVAYYQILFINEQEKLLLQNQTRLSKTIPIVKLQYEKGVAKKMDVDRVQVNLNNILANQEIIKTKKELAFNNLKYNMSFSLDSTIAIDTNYSKELIDLNTYSDTANIKNKIELKLLRKNLQLQSVLYKKTQAAYFPVLSFYAKYAGQTLGNKFAESFKHWSPIAALGIKLEVPIFDGFRTQSALKQARLNIESIKENVSMTEEGLKLQMKNSETQYSEAVKNIDINKTNMDLARNILDVVTLQFQKGVIGYSDLLSSESAYKEAELNYLSSYVDLLNAKLEIDKANGNLNKYK
ncbi:MAG TPA: TolC family protein [Chitinophagales bacterium]|nr:TolC family protein [Chitinophagales bacterium]